MIILIFLSIICITATSCEKIAKDETATISGTVTDQVNGAPVENANVGLIIQFYEDGRQNSNTIPGSTITDKDGKYVYNYVYNKDKPVNFDIFNIYFPSKFSVHSWKEGYSGSGLHPISDGDFESADIVMYRSAKVKIHAKNEGLNNLSDIDIGIDQGPGFKLMDKPEIIINCQGTDYDQTVLVENLSASITYYWKLVRHNSNYQINVFKSGNFIPKSESTLELYIPY